MQIFPTRMCNVTAWRHSRLRAHWLMALVGGAQGGGEGAEGELCILRSPGFAESPISLLSMGGVCGRSLTAGKILFSGRQTCSLYLVAIMNLCMKATFKHVTKIIGKNSRSPTLFGLNSVLRRFIRDSLRYAPIVYRLIDAAFIRILFR